MLSADAPLFQRATSVLRLRPLPFCWMSRLFPGLTPAERVAVYAVAGGVPGYLHEFVCAENFRAGLRRLLAPEGPLWADLPTLLADVPSGDEAILAAIAAGFHSLESISRASGVNPTELRERLYEMRCLGLIEENRLVLTPRSSREGRFDPCDAPLRFYYEFMAGRTRPFSRKRATDVATVSRVIRQLPGFIERGTFAEICRDWVWAEARRDRLGFVPAEVRSYWPVPRSRPGDLAVLAANVDDRQLLIGDVWWQSRLLPERALDDLLRRSRRIPQVAAGDWKVQHVLFARGGFTPALERAASRHGARLIGLDQIERDLIAAERQPEPEWGEIPF